MASLFSSRDDGRGVPNVDRGTQTGSMHVNGASNDLSAMFELAAGLPFGAKEALGEHFKLVADVWPVVFATVVGVCYVAYHPRSVALLRNFRMSMIQSTQPFARWTWVAVSTLVTTRSLVLWLASRSVVVQRIVEITGVAVALDVQRGRRRRRDEDKSSKRCHQEKYAELGNEPTTFPSGVTDVVQREDFERFKARVASVPNATPREESGEWQEMMDKEETSSACHYKAWRHILPYGGTEYLSRSVFQGATKEEICDFYNSDSTRDIWDKLLKKQYVVERDVRTGAEICFWERQLPVISNRDYVFSRRTWKDGDCYYTITRGLKHPKQGENPNVIRVDPYFSAWRMRTIPGDTPGTTAAECVLLHFEEQKVQQDVARMAVRHGMWGVVKNLCKGFREFQNTRQEEEALQDAGGVKRKDVKIREYGALPHVKKAIGFAFPVILGVLLAQQGTGNIFDVFTHVKHGVVVLQRRRHGMRAIRAVKTAGVVAAAAIAERAVDDLNADDASTHQCRDEGIDVV